MGNEGSTGFVILRVLMLIARMAADQLFIRRSRLHKMQAKSRVNLLHRSADCSEHSPLLTCMDVCVGLAPRRSDACGVPLQPRWLWWLWWLQIVPDFPSLHIAMMEGGYHTNQRNRYWIVQVGNIYLGDLFGNVIGFNDPGIHLPLSFSETWNATFVV